ncbi:MULTISPECIES: hypothetical protein [Streptomyces]|uniref:hypothetical protein n=1 Tax=Streptomyces TaxID=1883 RepID=UPI002270CA04|nr:MULTISPECIES: hypothetical protein [unclassified Streptomyces]MCY0943107.1 hypothetical protein [Streptomyces sp. H34-AA3]MCY0949715.1 hypothetical protein [Streptomyces sp. H27-S2]
MADHEKAPRHPRTTPSEAVGESGDREAREQADDAVVRRSPTSEGDEDAGGSSAKRQGPGVGREEQARPDTSQRSDSGGR